MIRPIQILNDLIASTAHTLKVSQVVDNLDGTYTLDVNFTYYLNSQRTITINSVSYRVVSFVLNESITIKGDSLPVTTSFDIDSPRFLHGTPKKVNGEMINENTKDYPFIWLLEFMDSDYDDNFNSAITVVLDLNLFFLTDVYQSNWNIDTHTREATDPMSNEIDFFIRTIQKRRDLFGEIEAHVVTNHVNFGEYIVNKGYDKKILSDNLSGSQLKMSLPYVVDVCIGDLPIVSKCFAATDVIKTSEGVTLYTNIIPSGGANEQTISDGTNTLNGGSIAGISAEGTKEITLKDDLGVTIIPTILVNTKTNLDLEVTVGTTALNTSGLNKTGKTSSLFNQDDGAKQFGNNVSFTVLDHNNGFGNTNRFTDTLGTQIYANDIVVDWRTFDQVADKVLCYYRVIEPSANLTTHMNNQPFTKEGFTQWYVTNTAQIFNLADYEIRRDYFNYAPFNHDVTATIDRLWTSTPDTATVGIYFGSVGLLVSTAGSVWKSMVCREFTLTELGL